MTSVVTRVRMVAAALPVAAVLALTGCSSDGGDTEKDNAKPTPDTSSSAPAETPDSGGSEEANGKGLDGSWVATKGEDAVALVVTGNQAGLFATGGSVCSGTAGDAGGMQMVKLKCNDGKSDRTTGHVKSVDAKSLTVSWEGFGEETFLRTEGTELPSGLPTGAPTS